MKRIVLSILLALTFLSVAQADWPYTTNVVVTSNGLTFTYLGLDAPADLTLFNENFQQIQSNGIDPSAVGYLVSNQTWTGSNLYTIVPKVNGTNVLLEGGIGSGVASWTAGTGLIDSGTATFPTGEVDFAAVPGLERYNVFGESNTVNDIYQTESGGATVKTSMKTIESIGTYEFQLRSENLRAWIDDLSPIGSNVLRIYNSKESPTCYIEMPGKSVLDEDMTLGAENAFIFERSGVTLGTWDETGLQLAGARPTLNDTNLMLEGEAGLINMNALTTNRQTIFVSSDGTNITAKVDTTVPGSALQMYWSNSLYSFSMPTNLTLTAGADYKTDAVNWIYSTPTEITTSTTRPTTGPYALLFKVVCKDAGTTYSNGNPVAVQRYTYMTDLQGKGRDSWQGEKIREAVGADLMDGCEINVITNAGTGIVVNVASGIIRQMHPQAWDAYSMATNGILIANGYDDADKFRRIHNFNELEGITTADGSTTTLNANLKRFAVQLYAVQSSGTTNAAPNELMLLLSNDDYSNDGQAQYDSDGYQVTKMPAAYKGMNVPLGRLVLRRNGGGSDWQAALYPPIGGGGSVAGTATGAGASFFDGDFEVTGTNSGAIKLSAAKLTADRTITMPDADVDLGDLGGEALTPDGTVSRTADQDYGGFSPTNVASVVYTNGSTFFQTANGTNYFTMQFAGTNWNIELVEP